MGSAGFTHALALNQVYAARYMALLTLIGPSNKSADSAGTTGLTHSALGGLSSYSRMDQRSKRGRKHVRPLEA